MEGAIKNASASLGNVSEDDASLMQNEPLVVFSSKIQQSISSDEVWDIIESICGSMDLTAAFCRCFPNGAAAEPVVFFSKTKGLSPEIEDALQRIPGYLDAFLHASVNSTKPFRWNEVANLLDPKSPQVETYHATLASLGDGVVVPVFGPHFRNGYFCYSGREDRDYSSHEMMLLHSLSQTAYLKLCDLMYRSDPNGRTLSSRELEIINIVARGKSSHAIASTLDVSVNTINTHLKRIFEKLDVTDRVSAVMRAYALGYIV